MPYQELWEGAVRDDWQLLAVEHKALAVGAFIVVAIMIWDRIQTWKRARRVEIELRKIQKKIYILEMQESGRLARLVRELNTKSRVKIEMGNSEDTATTISPPPIADRCENQK